jgi:hypothetical protein
MAPFYSLVLTRRNRAEISDSPDTFAVKGKQYVAVKHGEFAGEQRSEYADRGEAAEGERAGELFHIGSTGKLGRGLVRFRSVDRKRVKAKESMPFETAAETSNAHLLLLSSSLMAVSAFSRIDRSGEDFRRSKASSF